MTAVPPGKNKAHYRPDIDGLRAVAVLAVVLYHVKEALLPGGFAGVDVFFVISGFLITGNLYRGMSTDRFTFKDFYRRRLLRIFPPLVVVVLATLLIGHLVMLPEDLQAMSQSAVASMLSLANVYFLFFLDTSYFAADASVHPLLHIWSLGVEEQFYIFWPFLMLAFMARGIRGLAIMTLVIGLASFVLAELTVRDHPMFAYYMLPTRAGQLMSGALIFFMTQSNRFDLPGWLREIVALLGLLAVIASLWFVDGKLPYPGVSALPVTLGTAAIIWVGTNIEQRPMINRLLGVTPMIWIGLLSYSLYLWHWPIFAYWKYLYGEFGVVSGIVAVLVALGLSWLTYRFVETRFRRVDVSFLKIVNRSFVLPSAITIVAALGLHATNGYGVNALTNYPEKLESAKALETGMKDAGYICQRPLIRPDDLVSPRCVLNGDGAEPNILLWGDSNAAHYVGMLSAFAEHEGFSFRNVQHSSCFPFIGEPETLTKPALAKDCQVSSDLVVPTLDNYDVVILGGSWPGSIGSIGSQTDAGNRMLDETLDYLLSNRIEVILLGKTPVISNADPTCAFKTLKVPFLDCRANSTERSVDFRNANAHLRNVSNARAGVSYFDVTDYFCEGEICSAYLGEMYSYRDPGHLNLYGSWNLGHEIIERDGVPEAFSLFSKISPGPEWPKGQLREVMDRSFEGRFEDLQGGIALLDGNLAPRDWPHEWRGSRQGQNSAGAFLFEDTSEEKAPVIVHTFKPEELFDLNTTDEPVSIIAEIILDREQTTAKVATLIVGQSGSRNERVDLMAFHETEDVYRKKLATTYNTYVEYGPDEIRLVAAFGPIPPNTEIELRIPAAGSNGTRAYSPAGLGVSAIKSIKVSLED